MQAYVKNRRFRSTTDLLMKRGLTIHKDSVALVNVLLGIDSPSKLADVGDLEFYDTSLNDSQMRSVRFAIGCKDVACIHGPPGNCYVLFTRLLLKKLTSRNWKNAHTSGNHTTVTLPTLQGGLNADTSTGEENTGLWCIEPCGRQPFRKTASSASARACSNQVHESGPPRQSQRPSLGIRRNIGYADQSQ